MHQSFLSWHANITFIKDFNSYKVVRTDGLALPSRVHGFHPLHLGFPKEVEVLLIEHGAHLDAIDADGSTPYCCYKYYESHPRPHSKKFGGTLPPNTVG